MKNSLTSNSALPNGIIIVGAAKSGTTALFYAVRNTLQKRLGLRANGLFEPTESRTIREYLANGGDDVLLIKMLMAPFIRKEMKLFDEFDKKIIIFRDPRDNVVSRLVFMLPKLIEPSDDEKIDAVVQLLRRKESDPESLSVVAILREVSRITGKEQLLENVRNNAVLAARMKRESDGAYLLLSYEDFVQGNFADMNRYLGFDVDPEFQVSDHHSYVVRTKSSGSWKDWFLQEDIDYFVTEVVDDYRELGFDVSQPANATKTIDPKSCSEYALAQFTRLREKRQARKKGRTEKIPDQSKLVGKPAMPSGMDQQLAEKALMERRARRKRQELRRKVAAETGENKV